MLNKNNNLLVILSILGIFLIVFPATSQAYNDDDLATTVKERAVFAFFRALHDTPDYNFWITSNPEYGDLSLKQQQNYLLKETLRLGRGYSLFNQDKDVLEFNIDILAKYIPANDEKPPRITFSFFDTSDAYTPTFNYPYGDEALSLIINNLATFSDLPLNEAQNKAILKKIPYKNDYFDATLTVNIRVSKANYKIPINLRPVKQWLMIGEVAYLRCDVASYTNGKESKLWDYVAPWYAEAYRIKNMPEEEKYPHPFDIYKD